MALIQVTSAALRTGSENLQKLNGELKLQVASLEEMEGELNAMWEGEANQAFHNAFLSDKAQMDQFYAAIERYVASLAAIAVKYETAESANLETARVRSYH